MDRRARKAVAARVLAKAVADSPASLTALAAGLDLSRQRFSRLLDAEDEPGLLLADATALPAEVARPCLEWACRAFGWGVVEVPDPAAGAGGDLRCHALLARRLADTIAWHAEALADGLLDAGEAHQGLAQVEEALRELLALRARYGAVVEGVQSSGGSHPAPGGSRHEGSPK